MPYLKVIIAACVIGIVLSLAVIYAYRERT